MKITAVKTFLCNCYRTNWVFVKVETDTGPCGWGEATLEYREPTVAAAIHDLESWLLGKDPANIELFRHDCYRDAYWRGGPVLMSALAGVEIALWDIKGKRLGVPVYELLGGKVRDNVRCYASPMHIVDGDEELKASYLELKDQGFTAAKIFVNGYSGIMALARYIDPTPGGMGISSAIYGAIAMAIGAAVGFLLTWFLWDEKGWAAKGGKKKAA